MWQTQMFSNIQDETHRLLVSAHLALLKDWVGGRGSVTHLALPKYWAKHTWNKHNQKMDSCDFGIREWNIIPNFYIYQKGPKFP